MKFIVNGGKELNGEIEVRGSKNAATPILAATLLTKRPCVIKNLPLIGDVLTIIKLLISIGSEVEWLGERTVRITNNNIDLSGMDKVLVRRARSSILLIGPLLAQFREITISTPGGCYLGARPMDPHFDAFRELGFETEYNEKDETYNIKKVGEGGKKRVVLKEFSVTATENLMMYAARNGSFEILTAAAEPHVQDLGRFLQKLGASIDGLGTHEIKIKDSVKKEGGEVEHELINDYIEAGTFMALAAATRSNIKITGVPVDSLALPMKKLEEFGVDFGVKNNTVEIRGKSSKLKAVRQVDARIYPGFPSDLQAPFGVLATQSEGKTMIFDTLYEGRLKYLEELEKMGAKVKFLDSHRAIVKGATKLKGKNVESLDLRAGATLIIAALVAEGESVLHTAEQIDRGYEKIEERLGALGADIKRVT